jgi:hypothetical protein
MSIQLKEQITRAKEALQRSRELKRSRKVTKSIPMLNQVYGALVAPSELYLNLTPKKYLIVLIFQFSL